MRFYSRLARLSPNRQTSPEVTSRYMRCRCCRLRILLKVWNISWPIGITSFMLGIIFGSLDVCPMPAYHPIGIQSKGVSPVQRVPELPADSSRTAATYHSQSALRFYPCIAGLSPNRHVIPGCISVHARPNVPAYIFCSNPRTFPSQSVTHRQRCVPPSASHRSQPSLPRAIRQPARHILHHLSANRHIPTRRRYLCRHRFSFSPTNRHLLPRPRPTLGTTLLAISYVRITPLGLGTVLYSSGAGSLGGSFNGRGNVYKYTYIFPLGLGRRLT